MSVVMLHHSVIFYTAMIIGEYSEKEPVVRYGYYMDTEQTSNCIVFGFVIISLWQVMQQRLGVQLVGIFCEAEGPDFSKRVSTVLPLLSECLNVDDHVSFVVVIKNDDMI